MMKKRKKSRPVVFALSAMILLSGCSEKTETTKKTEVVIPMESQITFDGSRTVQTSDGHLWRPPAGSRMDKDGTIYDKEGCVIGSTGPIRSGGKG